MKGRVLNFNMNFVRHLAIDLSSKFCTKKVYGHKFVMLLTMCSNSENMVKKKNEFQIQRIKLFLMFVFA